MDFSRRRWSCRTRCVQERRLFFYPGSSIGNFTPDEALRLPAPRCAASAATDGGLLIGIDLVKDQAVLDAAYDDALGVTAAFNLNVLRHVNRLLGSDFDIRAMAPCRLLQRAARAGSRCTSRPKARSRCAGRAAAAVSKPASASTPRTATSTARADAIGLLEHAGFAADARVDRSARGSR